MTVYEREQNFVPPKKCSYCDSVLIVDGESGGLYCPKCNPLD